MIDRLGLNCKKFELTSDHIFEGIRKDGVDCPLALALREFFFCDMNLEDDPNLDDLEISVDFKAVSVEYVAINEDSDTWTIEFVLDEAVTDFIHDFDDELIAAKEFMGRTVRIELLEDQPYKLSFVEIVYCTRFFRPLPKGRLCYNDNLYLKGVSNGQTQKIHP